MVDLVNYLSGNRIIGDLIAREKYSFVDGKLIASIVDDVMAIVKDAAAGQGEAPVTSHNYADIIESSSPCDYCFHKADGVQCEICGHFSHSRFVGRKLSPVA